MGIKVEFNPDLTLRKFGTSGRKAEECLPENLLAGQTYKFLKEGQRNYWLEGEIPLLETQGNQQLSRPLASIRIKKTMRLSFFGCRKNHCVFSEQKILRIFLCSRSNRTLKGAVCVKLLDIIEATHFVEDGRVNTKGLYKVIEVFDSSDLQTHFNGFQRR